MVEAARDQLTAHKGNPMLMGRNGAVYEAMTMLTLMGVARFRSHVGRILCRVNSRKQSDQGE